MGRWLVQQHLSRMQAIARLAVLCLFEKRVQVALVCLCASVFVWVLLSRLPFLAGAHICRVLLCLPLLLPAPTRPHAAGNTSTCLCLHQFCSSSERTSGKPVAEDVPPCPTPFSGLLQASLLRLLVPPPPGSTAETLQNHLKLLAEVVRRTTSLTEGLQEIAGSAINVMELAESAFQDALAGHLALELQWLELLFAARSQPVRGWGGIHCTA